MYCTVHCTLYSIQCVSTVYNYRLDVLFDVPISKEHILTELLFYVKTSNLKY